MRERLTWRKDASQTKKADPYTMNQQHANNPVEKYHSGDPDSWAETPDARKPWADEGRLETGHPAPKSDMAPAAPAVPAAPAAPVAPAVPAGPMASEDQAQAAVKNARKLEDKALKCITIAQRMLPGADDQMIEKQATDLMYMPEQSVLSTLQRQAELAEKIAAEACPEEKDEKAETGKEPEAQPAAPEKEAAKDEKKPEKKPEEKPVEPAATPEAAPVAPEACVKADDKKDEKKPEEKPVDPNAAPAVPAPAMDKEASSGDLLDLIFAEEPKSGAKKLSGIVKQASVSESRLDTLWDAPPDVSKAFK